MKKRNSKRPHKTNPSKEAKKQRQLAQALKVERQNDIQVIDMNREEPIQTTIAPKKIHSDEKHPTDLLIREEESKSETHPQGFQVRESTCTVKASINKIIGQQAHHCLLSPNAETSGEAHLKTRQIRFTRSDVNETESVGRDSVVPPKFDGAEQRSENCNNGDEQSQYSTQTLQTNQIFQSRFFYNSQIDVSAEVEAPEADCCDFEGDHPSDRHFIEPSRSKVDKITNFYGPSEHPTNRDRNFEKLSVFNAAQSQAPYSNHRHFLKDPNFYDCKSFDLCGPACTKPEIRIDSLVERQTTSFRPSQGSQHSSASRRSQRHCKSIPSFLKNMNFSQQSLNSRVTRGQQSRVDQAMHQNKFMTNSFEEEEVIEENIEIEETTSDAHASSLSMAAAVKQRLEEAAMLQEADRGLYNISKCDSNKKKDTLVFEPSESQKEMLLKGLGKRLSVGVEESMQQAQVQSAQIYGEEPFMNKDYQQHMVKWSKPFHKSSLPVSQMQNQVQNHPFNYSARNSASSSQEEQFHMPFFPNTRIVKKNDGLFEAKFLEKGRAARAHAPDDYDIESNFQHLRGSVSQVNDFLGHQTQNENQDKDLLNSDEGEEKAPLPQTKENEYDHDFLSSLNNQVYQKGFNTNEGLQQQQERQDRKKLKRLDDIPVSQQYDDYYINTKSGSKNKNGGLRQSCDIENQRRRINEDMDESSEIFMLSQQMESRIKSQFGEMDLNPKGSAGNAFYHNAKISTENIPVIDFYPSASREENATDYNFGNAAEQLQHTGRTVNPAMSVSDDQYPSSSSYEDVEEENPSDSGVEQNQRLVPTANNESNTHTFGEQRMFAKNGSQTQAQQIMTFNSQANEKDEEDIVKVMNIEDEMQQNASLMNGSISEEIKEEIKVEMLSNDSTLENHEKSDVLFSRHSSSIIQQLPSSATDRQTANAGALHSQYSIQSQRSRKSKASIKSKRSDRKQDGPHKFSYFAASSLSDDRWLCPICLDIYEDAVETPCCHNLFCEACISQTTHCPLCKGRVVGQMKPNIPIRRLVHELSITCPNEDCNQIAKIGDIDKHLAQCQYTPVACPHSERCGKVTRKNLEQHKERECPYRVVGCILECGADLPLNEMDDHIRDRCPKLEIQCANACGASVQRGRMQLHIQQSCPLEVIECPNKGESLFEEGCTVKQKRRDMEQHKTTCPFRRLQCQNAGCQAVIMHKDLQTHDERCLWKVSECDNKCGHRIQRQNLERHRESCEFQLVKCPYYDLGCKIEILRKDYKNHLLEESFNHSIIFIEGQKRKNEEIRELKGDIAHLRKDYDVEIKTMFLELNRVKNQIQMIRSHTKMEGSELLNFLPDDHHPPQTQATRQLTTRAPLNPSPPKPKPPKLKQAPLNINGIINNCRLKPMIGLGNNRLNHFQNEMMKNQQRMFGNPQLQRNQQQQARGGTAPSNPQSLFRPLIPPRAPQNDFLNISSISKRTNKGSPSGSGSAVIMSSGQNHNNFAPSGSQLQPQQQSHIRHENHSYINIKDSSDSQTFAPTLPNARPFAGERPQNSANNRQSSDNLSNDRNPLNSNYLFIGSQQRLMSSSPDIQRQHMHEEQQKTSSRQISERLLTDQERSRSSERNLNRKMIEQSFKNWQHNDQPPMNGFAQPRIRRVPQLKRLEDVCAYEETKEAPPNARDNQQNLQVVDEDKDTYSLNSNNFCDWVDNEYEQSEKKANEDKPRHATMFGISKNAELFNYSSKQRSNSADSRGDKKVVISAALNKRNNAPVLEQHHGQNSADSHLTLISPSSSRSHQPQLFQALDREVGAINSKTLRPILPPVKRQSLQQEKLTYQKAEIPQLQKKVAAKINDIDSENVLYDEDYHWEEHKQEQNHPHEEIKTMDDVDDLFADPWENVTKKQLQSSGGPDEWGAQELQNADESSWFKEFGLDQHDQPRGSNPNYQQPGGRQRHRIFGQGNRIQPERQSNSIFSVEPLQTDQIGRRSFGENNDSFNNHPSQSNQQSSNNQQKDLLRVISM